MSVSGTAADRFDSCQYGRVKWPSVADKTGAERHHAALVLFGRAVVTTLTMSSPAHSAFSPACTPAARNYDPYAYATGVGALFAAACAVIAYLLFRRRVRADTIGVRSKRASTISPTAIGNCARPKSARAACSKRKAT